MVGMRLHLDHRRLDSSGIDDPAGTFDSDVGEPDRSTEPVIDKALHGTPRLLQSDAIVVDHGPMCVAGILVFAGPEREWRVDQIEIDGVESEPVQAGLQRRLHPFGSMVVVPQLGGDEQVLTADRSLGE